MTRLLAIPMTFIVVFLVGALFTLPSLGTDLGDRLLILGAQGVFGCLILAIALATVCTALWGWGESDDEADEPEAGR